MSLSPIGGRLIQWDENDPYRGQKRRPYIVLRLGTNTPALSDTIFCEYIEKVRKNLISSGILLDEEDAFLLYICRFNSSTEECETLKDKITEALKRKDQLYEIGPLSVPTAIYVKDAGLDCSDFDDVLFHFFDYIDFFRIEADELIEQHTSSDYTELKNWCIEFAKLKKGKENLAESIALPSPVEIKNEPFGSKKINLVQPNLHNHQNGGGRADHNKDRMHQQRYENGKRDREMEGPPGLRRNIDHSRGSVQKEARSDGSGPPPGLGYRQQPSTSGGSPPGLVLASPPGIKLCSPPGLPEPSSRNPNKEKEIEKEASFDSSEAEEDDLPVYSHANIKQIIDDYELLSNSKFKMRSFQVETLCDDTFYMRLNKPFSQAVENVNMMIVLNHAISSISESNVRHIELLISQCFKLRYPDKLVKSFIEPSIQKRRIDVTHKQLYFEIALLYNNVCELRPSHINNDIQVCWANYFKLLDHASAIMVPFYKHYELNDHRLMCDRVEKYFQQISGKSIKEKAQFEDENVNRMNQRRKPINRGSFDTDDEEEDRMKEERRNYREVQRQPLSHQHYHQNNRREYEERRHNRDYYDNDEKLNQREKLPSQRENYQQEYDYDRRRTAQEPQYPRNERTSYLPEKTENERQKESRIPVKREAEEQGFDDSTSDSDSSWTMKDEGTIKQREEIPASSSSYEQHHIPPQELFSPTPQDEGKPYINVDDVEPQPYMFSKNYPDEENADFIPSWQKCESKNPPEDFRTLTTIPTIADYHNAVEPYLRRIREDGIYSSPEHYLDVQFRLMREDLVSPLRDGVDIYKKNGTTRQNRLADGLNSDIMRNVLVRIYGKQVSPKDGLEMRLAIINEDLFKRLTLDKKEIKDGGLVLLSSDGFTKDVHLAKINDAVPKRRNFTPKKDTMLNVEPYISLVIFDENKESPFKKNTPYEMVEASSYLPTYEFVLQNIKNINRYIALPFERYIVYGKKTIYRPAFHMQPKDEEQIHDERRIEKYYNDVRSTAKANMIKNGYESEEEEYHEEDFLNQFGGFKKIKQVKNKRSQKNEVFQEEKEKLSEPIFNQQVGFVSAEEGDKIRIDGAWYKVSRLLSDFHPNYMDESQRVAFCNTFNREFSIIQGPPGTGKTHIGVSIVKTMLLNRDRWKMTSPILVVCYTNSAVDQFLERILLMMNDCEEFLHSDYPKMVRYGSKSQSELLKGAGVLREEVCRNFKHLANPEITAKQNSAFKEKTKKAQALGAASSVLYVSRREIMACSVIVPIMGSRFRQELEAWSRTHTDSNGFALSRDEAFACWLLDTSFGERNAPGSSGSFAALRLDKSTPVEVDENSTDEDDNENEDPISKMLERMNIACSENEKLENDENAHGEDSYHYETPWIVGERTRDIVLFAIADKEIGRTVNAVTCVPVERVLVEQIEHTKDLILDAKPLKFAELDDIKSIFSLTRPKRWALYQYWITTLRKQVSNEMPQIISSYKKACEKAAKLQMENDACILKKTMIIGATTTGCSRIRPLLEIIKPKILVVEEAAEVLEAHILSAMLPSMEQVVMIGDHQQLRPSPAVHELGVEYGMQISMFERLVERGLPYSQLKKQHRMNVDIANCIVRPSFYKNVIDAENVKEYPDVRGMATNLYFWSHSRMESSNDSVSWCNKHEVLMTVHLVAHLLKQSYQPTDITVITTYSSQRSELLKSFSVHFGGSMEDPFIPVETVDSYQGRENKIVIVSLVRSHRGKEEHTGIGFLSVANRICVALTRAQHGMYIVGNAMYLAYQSNLWNEIQKNMNQLSLINYHIPVKCSNHGNIEEIECPEDFLMKSPEGGCHLNCGMEKPCGHSCKKKCHPNAEVEHSMDRCNEICKKMCPRVDYKHLCQRRCNESCGQCSVYVDLNLSCGHSVTTPCWNLENVKCDKKCSETLDCGHVCSQRCGAPCSRREDCTEEVSQKLPCGHTRVIKCNFVWSQKENIDCIEQCQEKNMGCDHQCVERCGAPCTIVCKAKVPVDLKCGHTTEVDCYELEFDQKIPTIDEAEYPCKTPVKKVLKPCNHEGMVPCSEEPETKDCQTVCREIVEKCGHECGNSCGKCYTTKKHCCQVKCRKMLNCGHECSAKCGEPCSCCSSYCNTNCSHMCCGMGKKNFPGFGRVCKQLCVLCVRHCSNQCPHRSCKKLCYEKCDVKPCNERCTMLLRCKHACLGLCGEQCPEICATCKLNEYEACIKMLKVKSSNKVHKLIQIPSCKHTFPVKFLDEYVDGLKNRNQNLICPKEGCGKRMDEIQRHLPYTKSRTYIDNLNKQKAIEIKDRSLTYKTTLTNLEVCTNNIVPSTKNKFDGFSSKMKEVVQEIRSISTTMMLSLATKKEKHPNLIFFDKMSKCMLAVRRIFISMIGLRSSLKAFDLPYRFQSVMQQQYRELDIFVKQVDLIKDVLTDIQKHWKAEMIGSIIQRVLSRIAKLLVALQMMFLWKELLQQGIDLSDKEASALQTYLANFSQLDERNQYVAVMFNIQTFVNSIHPSIEKAAGYLSWSMLSLEEF